ncbi:MAG TPA: AAA family ATPase [Chloroflexota bacterium]
MRLRCFEVEGLAQLEHERIVFRDGAPSLIVGPNEAGKTHLMLGLCGMFFGLDDPEKLKPWSGPDTMRGVLDFEDANGHPVHLERDYLSDTVQVGADGEQWTARWDGKGGEAQRFLDELDSWLGFREPSIFLATAFIRQSEVTAAEIKGVAPEIKRLITGTVESSYERVLKELNDSLDGLRRPAAVRKESRLERLQESLRQLEAQRRGAHEREDRILRLRQIRDRVAADVEQKAQQEQRLVQQLEIVGNLEQLEGQQSRLRKQLERLDSQIESVQRGQMVLQTARAERDRYAGAAETDKNDLFALDRAVRDTEEALDRISGAPSQSKALRNRFLGKPREQAPPPDLTPEDLTEQIWKAREARDTALRRMGVATMAQALDVRDRYEKANVEVVKAESYLDALGDETDVIMQREDVAHELSEVTEQLNDLLASDVDEKQVQHRDIFRKTLVSLRDEIGVLRNDQAEAERKLRIEGESEQDVAQIGREIERTRVEIDETKDLIAAHDLAIGTLQDCVAGFQDHCLDGVTAQASRMLSTLTDGRYTRVTLRDGDLEPLVDMPGRPRIPSARLSRGTRDQLYFVLRVALAQALANDRRLPMILDDPFVHYDPERVERTVDMLRALAEQTQVVFFTADPRYEDWFEPVLRLGATPVETIATEVA